MPNASRRKKTQRKRDLKMRNELIIAALRRGEKPREVAEAFGLSIHAVLMIKSQNGLRVKPLLDARRKARLDKVVALVKKGHSAAYIAGELGTTRAAIYSLLQKGGTSINKIKWEVGLSSTRDRAETDERNRLIYDQYEAGYTMRQIAEKHGMTYQRVDQIIQRQKALEKRASQA